MPAVLAVTRRAYLFQKTSSVTLAAALAITNSGHEGREWLTFTLSLRVRVTHHLAKPVQKRESRVCTLHPLASALYVQSVAPTGFGVMAFGILRLRTGSKDGFAASAASGSQILRILRELGARLSVLRELRRSH